MSSNLTVAVITKNRPQKLTRCLESITNQTLLPARVLIIDNDIKKSAKIIFDKYKKILPLSYINEKRSGVPFARNTALKNTKTKYLGFTDDDCVLDPNWIKSAVQAFKKPDIAYVCGLTELFNNKNILATAQHLHDWYWYIKKIKQKKGTSAENFDTKNIVIDKNMILKNGLKFDTRCSINGFDSADFDFGLQVENHGLKGIYLKTMKSKHEETSTLKRYILRAYYRGMLAHYINRKWEFKNKYVDIPNTNMLVWLRRKIFKIPFDLKKYTKGLDAPLYFKFLVTLAIILYEGSYLNGFKNALNE